MDSDRPDALGASFRRLDDEVNYLVLAPGQDERLLRKSGGSQRVFPVRTGYAYDRDPNMAKPLAVCALVNAPGYAETWVEGLDVFHHPRAKYPVEPWMLPAAAHHRLREDGRGTSGHAQALDRR